MDRSQRPWAIGAATVAGYAASIYIRRQFLTANPEAAIWLAAVLVAGLLLLSHKGRLACIAACIGVDLVASLYFGLSIRTFLTFPLALGVAYATERLLGPGLNFADPRRLAMYLAGAVAPACALTAGIQLWLTFGAAPASVASVTHWTVGHFLGLAILTPSLMILAQARRFKSFRRPPGEVAAALLATAAAVIFLLWGLAGAGWPLLIFPMAMFIAFRYGPVGVSLLSLMLTAIAIVFVYRADAAVVASGQIEQVQMLVAVVSLTSLPVAGVVASLQRVHSLFARRTAMARLARTRADQAAKARGEFLANMSHEIRTPLNGVIGLADALSRTPLDAGQKEMLGMILNSGQALRGLLSDALDLARIQSGALAVVDEPFDPCETIGAAAYLFQSLATGKGLEFEVEFDVPKSLRLVGDPLRIRQIISNLISNAVKFTERGGVEVRTEVREDGAGRARLTVVVRDSGRGFDAETKARLFNRFEQGDNSVTRRYGGSGLGLSIVRELSTMMGGDVSCTSMPGFGSVFTFEIVLAVEATQAPAVEVCTQEPAPVTAERSKVLLAEDHPVNQRVVQALFGDRFDLTIVGDGEAAVEAFRSKNFDLVLMDTHMPVMDGLSAIRAIRALEASLGSARTAIISLTADALAEHIELTRRAGADGHLAKPITAASLFGAIAALEEAPAEERLSA